MVNQSVSAAGRKPIPDLALLLALGGRYKMMVGGNRAVPLGFEHYAICPQSGIVQIISLGYVYGRQLYHFPRERAASCQGECGQGECDHAWVIMIPHRRCNGINVSKWQADLGHRRALKSRRRR